MSLYLSSTAIWTLKPATVPPFFDNSRASASVRDSRPVPPGERGHRGISGAPAPQPAGPVPVGLAPPPQTARRAHLVEIAVQIKLQQIGRVVRRLAHSHTTLGMSKAELSNIERRHIALDRPHWIVRCDVIFNPRR